MSKSNNTSTAVAKKPFCGACQKAGKTEQEYTSHWTRSNPGKDGTVTCPFILNSVCGYCRNSGHWKKFCPVLEQKEKDKKKSQYQKSAVSVEDKQKSVNIFSLLEEEDNNNTPTESFPALSSVPVMNKELKMSWVSVVNKQPPAPPPTKPTVAVVENPPMKKIKEYVRYIGKWADAESSDEEEDYLPVGKLA
jgi:hypothetical protein